MSQFEGDAFSKCLQDTAMTKREALFLKILLQIKLKFKKMSHFNLYYTIIKILLDRGEKRDLR